MTRRAWILVVSAYLIAFLGLILALTLIHNQQEDNKNQNAAIEVVVNRLSAAAGAYCEVGLLPDAQENAGLENVANGLPIPEDPSKIADIFPHRVCKTIVHRLEYGP